MLYNQNRSTVFIKKGETKMNRNQSHALKTALIKGVKVWCTHCKRNFISHKTQAVCPVCGHVFIADIVFENNRK